MCKENSDTAIICYNRHRSYGALEPLTFIHFAMESLMPFYYGKPKQKLAGKPCTQNLPEQKVKRRNKFSLPCCCWGDHTSYLRIVECMMH